MNSSPLTRQLGFSVLLSGFCAIASNTKIEAAVGTAAARNRLPVAQAAYWPVTNVDPKAMRELLLILAARSSSAKVAIHSGVVVTRTGTGIGSPRSAAKQAATTSLTRLETPSSHPAENFTTVSIESPVGVSQTRSKGLCDRFPSGERIQLV